MLQQDYLLRMFTALAVAIRESIMRAQGDEDPEGAAELLEAALDNSTEIDGSLLLQMAPESFVTMIQLSQTDPDLIGYISRTLMLESQYLREAGLDTKANLREAQAQALARAYGFEVDASDVSPEALDAFFGEENEEEESLFEPFEGCPYNPIMTHRHLGWNYPIVNVGHPDIVETQNGEWWMVLLASRPYGDGYYRNLGRETFLTPMTWENGWPIINPGKGIIEDHVNAPDLPTFFAKKEACREDFDHIAQKGLPKHFMYLRNPIQENYDLSKNGVLSLRCGKDLLSSDGQPSYVCIRQKDSSFAFETALHLEGKENEQAGIALFQSTDYQYQYLAGTNGNATTLQIIKVEKGESSVVCEKTLDARYPDLILRLEADQQNLRFVYSTPEESLFTETASGLSAHILCTDIAGGFVGNTMGVYATANGSDSDTFDYMEYIPCGELNLK